MRMRERAVMWVRSTPLLGHRAQYAWGFADQGLSSATNLALSVVAGRLLGQSGLGIVAIGFALYLLALGFQRALISEPLAALSGRLATDVWKKGVTASLFVVVVHAGVWSAGLAVAGWRAEGSLRIALFSFAPWILPSLLQDFWRSVFFQEGRGRAATFNELYWVAGMVVAYTLMSGDPSEWKVVAMWGTGAGTAAVAGLVQARHLIVADSGFFRGWASTSWPLGRWLAFQSGVYALASQGIVFALGGLLGVEALGSLRAAQVVFGPLSVLGPALMIAGLPAVSRRMAESDIAARRSAGSLSLLSVLMTGAYTVVMALFGRFVLRVAFGEVFATSAALLWPVAAGQVLVAASIGPQLVLRAQGRGAGLFAARTTGVVVMLALGTLLAAFGGLVPAAWGLAAGSAIGTLLLFVAARPER